MSTDPNNSAMQSSTPQQNPVPDGSTVVIPVPKQMAPNTAVPVMSTGASTAPLAPTTTVPVAAQAQVVNVVAEPLKIQEPAVEVNSPPAADPNEKDKSKEDKAPAAAATGNFQAMNDIGGLLDNIVATALEKRASDIHMEPNDKNLIVRFRIDGMLREAFKIDKIIEQALIFKVKVSAKLRTDEHLAPQDGRIGFLINGKTLDTRISILPITKGEKVVIRLLTQDGKSFTLEDLGLRGTELEIVKRSYSKPYGTILAVGPTGSGKTTTLYAILKIINSREKNITTIEDPVEYDIDGVNHIQINTKTNLTFANGLRSILRQDPDVVMVGEIRDGETARIAVNAAMTGHLVLSTLHTNDSVTTIPRLIDMGIEPFLVASTINVIIAQRLARVLCKFCKKESVLSEAEFTELSKMRWDITALMKAGEKVFVKVGCSKCNNIGYKGRMGLYEVLEVNESIRKIITTSTNMDEIYKTARANKMRLILEDGIERVKEGTIDLAELVRVTALKE